MIHHQSKSMWLLDLFLLTSLCLRTRLIHQWNTLLSKEFRQVWATGITVSVLLKITLLASMVCYIESGNKAIRRLTKVVCCSCTSPPLTPKKGEKKKEEEREKNCHAMPCCFLCLSCHYLWILLHLVFVYLNLTSCLCSLPFNDKVSVSSVSFVAFVCL